ncbi:N-acetylmuramoyl-L-alanine amidase, partial [Streptomyces sp. NPDC059627]
MRRTVAPRVPGALRTCRLTACLIATAALLPPLLILPASGADEAEDQRLQNAFTDAAREFHVPRSVLMSVSYMQSRWDTHPGTPSVAGGYGPMHLVDTDRAPADAPAPGPSASDGRKADPLAGTAFAAGGHAVQPANLERAARLIQVPAGQLRTDAVANVRGGAAL